MLNLEQQIAEWEQKSYIDLPSFAASLQLGSNAGRFDTAKHKDICRSLERVWTLMDFGKQGIFVLPKEHENKENVTYIETFAPIHPLSIALRTSGRTLQRWKRGEHEGIYVDGDGKGNYGFISALATAIKTGKRIHSALKKYIPNGLWEINHRYDWDEDFDRQDSDWDAIA
jgi:hypothetical protein